MTLFYWSRIRFWHFCVTNTVWSIHCTWLYSVITLIYTLDAWLLATIHANYCNCEVWNRFCIEMLSGIQYGVLHWYSQFSLTNSRLCSVTICSSTQHKINSQACQGVLKVNLFLYTVNWERDYWIDQLGENLISLSSQLSCHCLECVFLCWATIAVNNLTHSLFFSKLARCCIFYLSIEGNIF